MEIILSHNNLDCDGLASLLAMARLRKGASPVLIGNLNRNVRDILAGYGTELPFRRPRTLPPEPIERLILVDTQTIPADEWVQTRVLASRPTIEIIDHHPPSADMPPGAHFRGGDTGATTTILVEEMQREGITIPSLDATILLLGIYEDTGALTYRTTTARDARAVAWLLEHGARLDTVGEYLDRPLSPRQWTAYQSLMASARVEDVIGHKVLIATARAAAYVEEISTLAHKLNDLYEADASFILVQMEDVVQVIARSRSDDIDVAAVLRPLGGGGHSAAAAALVRGSNVDIERVRQDLWDSLLACTAPVLTAQAIMTRVTHTVPAQMSMAEAYAIMRRHGHDGLPVVDGDRLVGIITRRDADKAIHLGLGHVEVQTYCTMDAPTVFPQTPIAAVQDVLRDSSLSQVPVVEGGRIVGMVTRADVLSLSRGRPESRAINLAERLDRMLDAEVRRLLLLAANTAMHLGYSLYLVGGFVRDLLLGLPNFDLDLVVEGDAIALAKHLAAEHGGRTKSHARFGTAKWIIPDNRGREISLDFVTARTEFYEHPAALPTVEAGSLRQDLYRRDFTINTMAICLDPRRYGELIDYYGGMQDLQERRIRVLHNLSFVEDATRILRAARLAERLGFTIEERTLALIPHAWESLDRVSGDRIRHELRLIFQEAEPERVIRRLHELEVLAHLHPALRYDDTVATRFAAVRAHMERWRTWGWGNGGRGGDERTARDAAYLALLAYPLDRTDMGILTERLRITGPMGLIMRQVWALRRHLPELVIPDLRPSRLHRLLEPFILEALFILAIAEEEPIPSRIMHDVQDLRRMRPAIGGEFLKTLGIPPGPIYTQVLAALRDAKLDGQVSTAEEEEEFVRARLAEILPPSSTHAGQASPR